MSLATPNPPSISAIVPARNEEAVIEACVESLAQQSEITEILVVDDQSTDRTAEIVRRLGGKHRKVKLLEAGTLPHGWVGKNHAVWIGAQAATGDWLLFTDADVVHGANSAQKALQLADPKVTPVASRLAAGPAPSRRAATPAGAPAVALPQLISFSPEQITETWYEKSLIPVVYCRLASKFSFAEVNDPRNPAAAANGQFLMIRRQGYNALGGHAAISGEILEDVALAQRAKQAGYGIWFGSGKGTVRVRMYRSFSAMWEGWEKNLFGLMGGSARAVGAEILNAVIPIALMLFFVGVLWLGSGHWRTGLIAAAVALGMWHWMYSLELVRNQFPLPLTIYGIPGKLLFAAVLWASYRGHQKGKLRWKGREYPVGTSGASNR